MTPATVAHGIACTLEGPIVFGPELRWTAAAGTVCNFTVLVDGAGYVRGQRERARQRVRIAVWGDRGELLAAQLARHVCVRVEGWLTIATWRAKDGSLRRGLHVQALRVAQLTQAATPTAEEIPA